MNKWMKAISIDITVISCIVASIWFNYEWAENIALFIIWSLSLLILLLILSGRKGQELLIIKRKKCSALFNLYERVTDIGFIILLAALGWFATAGIYLFSKMAIEALLRDIIKAP